MKTKSVRIFCPSARGIDKRQLAKGIKVELEHTKDRAAARCIALIHIHEFSDYYPRLAEMERAAKRRK